MSGTTKGLNRQQMADRIAQEFQDGWIVNLGVGIPTMCSNTDIGENLIDLVLATTQYRGNARVITAAQQMLDELLNLRR